MAPMIDMVFLLLVFFMCVSSLSQAGNRVEVELPHSEESQIPRDLSGRVTLSIQASGAYFLNGLPVERDALPGEFERLAGLGDPLKLRVRADRETPFRDVQAAMEAAAGAGVGEVIYAALQAE